MLALPLALLFCFLTTAGTTTATVTDTVTFDGVWWQSMSRSDKLIAVQGMLVGYDSGYLRAATLASDATEGTGTTFFHTLTNQQPGMADLTFGQIVDRIDAVFISHSSLRSKDVSLFFECAAIESWDCEVTVQQINT